MVSKTIQKLPKSLVEVTITVPWADVEPKWNETLNRLAAEVELPGFRKGQAPLNMVEGQLGPKLQDEVFKVAFPQALVEALQGSGVVPIDYPRYQLVSFTKGQSLVFKAAVTERPQVAIGNYKSISVQRPRLREVTEEDLNKVIADLFKRWQSKQLGGSNLSISFSPPPAQAPTVNPATQPDDNFARALGTQNLADLGAKIRADLESEAKFNNELDYEEAILQEVEKTTQVEVPEVLIADELHRMLVSMQKRVADMGLLLDEYLKGQGETVESLQNRWRSQAERNVKMELGLSEIARQENVDITDTELQAEVDKIQDAKLKMQFEAAEPRMHLKHSLRQVKTLDLLKSLVRSA